MRLIVGVLTVLLLLLQYRLWFSDHGMREVWRLDRVVQAQRKENHELEQRNRALAAEVEDLKEGIDAVEERARTDLGMVGRTETYYQVMTEDTREHSDEH